MTVTEPKPLLIRGDARRLPLADESVDLVVTSPPYWSLRSYSDAGQHYDDQIGSEPTWQEYLDSLIECTREMMRVLKPSGSIWLNLGDKYAGAGGGGNGSSDGLTGRHARHRRRGNEIPAKSLHLLPHRYAIRCADELGLIVRQDQVWAKVNGLPESVTDRTRRDHEYLFHMVKSPRYYSAVDEIREPHQTSYATKTWSERRADGAPMRYGEQAIPVPVGHNPLGKLPGSVWSIPSQPLNVPDHISHARCCDGQKQDGCEDGLDHYAAFPFALVRPIILGWSPREVCTACGEGRRPISKAAAFKPKTWTGAQQASGRGWHGGDPETRSLGISADLRCRTITGYSCACPVVTAPTSLGVVLDPFGGTGSTALVAAMSGRVGISIDASWDYSDVIARWRINDPKERARAAGLDPDVVARISTPDVRQGSLWDLFEGAAS